MQLAVIYELLQQEQATMMKKPTYSLIFLLIIGVSCYLMKMSIHDGHRWDDDYALYVAQAKSVLNGSEQQLLKLNTFSMANSVEETGPYLYPFGFPLLLAPIYFFLGLNFFAMKAMNVCFFMGAILLLYRLLSKYIQDAFFLFSLLILIAWNSDFVGFSDYIYSDFTFFFFCFLAFTRMEKKISVVNQIFTGAAIYYAYFIRDAGIFLLPALVTYQLFVCKEVVAKLNSKWLLGLPYLVFSLLFVVCGHWFPKGSSNLVKLLFTKFNATDLLALLRFYAEILTQFLFSAKLSITFFLFALLLIFTGMIHNLKTHLHFVVFCLSIFMLLMIFPNTQGLRYTYPVLPFLVYFLVNGILFYRNRYSISDRYLKLFLGILMLIGSYRNIRQIVDFSTYDTNQAYSTEMRQVYAFIRSSTPDSAVIGFFKPRGLRLYTDHNAILTDELHFTASKADYLLTGKPLQQLSSASRLKVLETDHFVLLKK